jgi:dihydroorotase
MTPEDRLAEIDQTLEALRPAWPHLRVLLEGKRADLTVQLIAQDNEQVRGRIKALGDLLELPETLQQEREGIRAGLAE